MERFGQKLTFKAFWPTFFSNKKLIKKQKQKHKQKQKQIN